MAKQETRLVGAIVHAMRADGVYCVKLHGSAYQQAGLPDLLCIVDGHAVFMEVKTDTGHPTRLQLHTINELRATGATVEIVRSVTHARRVITLVKRRRKR